MRRCVDCGEYIPIQRLKALPHAVLCTRCVVGMGDVDLVMAGEEPAELDFLPEDFVVDVFDADDGVYDAHDSPNPNPITQISMEEAKRCW